MDENGSTTPFSSTYFYAFSKPTSARQGRAEEEKTSHAESDATLILRMVSLCQPIVFLKRLSRTYRAKVNGAVNALQTALGQLAVKPAPAPVAPTVDKTALHSLITLADAKVETNYTADSWLFFNTALVNAKQAETNVDATAEEVTAALTALQTAMDGLILNPTTAPANETGFSPVIVGAAAVVGVIGAASIASPIAFAIGKKQG